MSAQDNPTSLPPDLARPPVGAPARGGAARLLKWALLIILLVVLGVAVVVYLNLNRIVKATVETQSTRSLNVGTSLGAANVSLLGGDVTLTEFDVGSPPGFVAPYLLTVGQLSVDTSFGELRARPMRIASIQIQRPAMVIEMKGMQFNVRKFIENLPEDEETAEKPAEEPLKLIIGRLSVEGAQVTFRPDMNALAAVPGLAEAARIKNEYVLSIPTIELRDIGTGEGNQNGAAIKEVVTLLVTELASKAAQSEQLPPEVRQLLSGDVSQLADLAKQKLGAEVNKQLGKVTEQLEGKMPPELGTAIEGVLGGKRESSSEAAKDSGKAIEQGLGELLRGQRERSPATKP